MRRNKGIVTFIDNSDMATRIEQWPRALAAPELADLLGMSRSAIYGLVQRGELPHYRVGNSVRLDPHGIAEWLRKRETGFPEQTCPAEHIDQSEVTA